MKLCTFALISGVVYFSSCGSASYQTRDFHALQGLAQSKDGPNIALILGAPNDLLGVTTDIKEMDKLFRKKTLNFNFETTSKNHINASEVLSLTEDLAKNADSFLWYFSGHGMQGGLVAEDREFSFKDILNTIRTSRNHKPLKRFIVFLDSCFSGSLLNEPGSRPKEDATAENFKVFIEKEIFAPLCFNDFKEEDGDDVNEDPSSSSCKGNDLFEQAFVMVSSRANEPSEDLDKKRGGAFTYSLRTTIEKLKKESPKATIKNLAEETRMLTKDISGQTPVFKFFPKATVGQDKLFKYR